MKNFGEFLKEFEYGKRHFVGRPIRDLPMRCVIKNEQELKRILEYGKKHDLDNRK